MLCLFDVIEDPTISISFWACRIYDDFWIKTLWTYRSSTTNNDSLENICSLVVRGFLDVTI